MQLTTKQKQQLKGMAHPLKPVVMLGSNGLTEGVIAEIEQNLEYHELIKVKIPTTEKDIKRAIIDAIIRETNACEVQLIGHMLVLYRQSSDTKIVLVKAKNSRN